MGIFFGVCHHSATPARDIQNRLKNLPAEKIEKAAAQTSSIRTVKWRR
ncbi:MAG: hypothetical protein OP8BY_2270 [Candidatus Saccharicenans subterraneus]|uniref:Uncharacterized protein n=1 Tax=Candidatus Saccharicenans subterraneus TaxID=2508984 RepID=A0A3E2BML2_9BACT|nr:MAG: hypothetical protein OP8BY_2270 [Candidatus Saccharicenans subterraneum]